MASYEWQLKKDIPELGKAGDVVVWADGAAYIVHKISTHAQAVILQHAEDLEILSPVAPLLSDLLRQERA